jgi:hypothetical protein
LLGKRDPLLFVVSRISSFNVLARCNPQIERRLGQFRRKKELGSPKIALPNRPLKSVDRARGAAP